jgi:hypothetical protein
MRVYLDKATSRIPMASNLDEAAVRRFAGFRDAIRGQIWGVIDHGAED